jgi:hypothetical protein
VGGIQACEELPEVNIKKPPAGKTDKPAGGFFVVFRRNGAENTPKQLLGDNSFGFPLVFFAYILYNAHINK